MTEVRDDDEEHEVPTTWRDAPVLQLRPFYFEWPISSTTFRHCCEHMGYAVAFSCDMHASPFECWDNEFIYNEVYDEYGAISRNPDNHYTMLRFCPFCGTKLPESRRDEWENALKDQGFDLFGNAFGAAHDETKSYTKAWRAIGVPERYLTAGWRTTDKEQEQ